MSIDKKPVDAIKHDKDKRVLIPTTELAGEEKMATEQTNGKARYQAFCHDFDRGRDPELYWLGKYRNDDQATADAEIQIDTRSLYVHEDIQPERMINALYRLREEHHTPMLFSEEELGNTAVEDELQRVTEYYHHDINWKNRLIQGDSLLVMNSLLQREGMAGKVQCVYIDPPYGIKFGSNWQMKLNDRNVKDNDESLSGEPEMIKAFRDTWELGIHSYLSYLRDRLVTARELLSQSGSCFVQISDENVHLVRCLMDEVFGSENFVSQIVYQKTTGAGAPGDLLAPASVCDYIIWYSKNKSELKYRKIFVEKKACGEGLDGYNYIEENGIRTSVSEWQTNNNKIFDKSNADEIKLFRLSDLTSQTGSDSNRFPIEFEGETYMPSKIRGWRTGKEGINLLLKQKRIMVAKKVLRFVDYLDDFPYVEKNNLWTDTSSNLGSEKLYVVQSGLKPIQRCILMTTDPGDLVLDPTCGSGTTAYAAEQWGRRWITIDTSA